MSEPATPPRAWRAPRGKIALTSIHGLCLVASTFVQALLIGGIIDGVLKGSPLSLPTLGTLGGITIVKAYLNWFSRMNAFDASAGIKKDVRASILEQIFRLGPGTRATHRSGGIMHDAVEGVEALDPYYGFFLPQLVIGLGGPLLLCAAVAWLDLPTGLVLLATAPLAPLLMGFMQGRFRSVSRRYHATANRLSAEFLDSVQGLPTLKMFNRGQSHGKSLRVRSEKLRRETMRLLAINQIAIFILDWGFAIGATTAGFVITALRMRAGALSAGEAVAVILVTIEIIRQFNLLGAFFFAGAGGRAMLKRIREFLGKPAPVVDYAQNGQRLPEAPFDIRFDNVNFGYTPGELVLRSTSFAVGAAETAVIVGENGAGKSTITHLLLRFSDPQSGRILIGGRDISTLPLAWLRQQIAMVSQETWLFHDTIAGNLRLAKPTATRGEMEHALREASLDTWVSSLPLGLDTPLGERGEKLSGGQAQRLSVARAFLKDAPILILDEPTAHVDSATEFHINEALARLAHGRTVVHITHRPRTLLEADHCFHLRYGEQIQQLPLPARLAAAA